MNVSNDGTVNVGDDNDCGVLDSESEFIKAMEKLLKEKAREDDFLIINYLCN